MWGVHATTAVVAGEMAHVVGRCGARLQDVTGREKARWLQLREPLVTARGLIIICALIVQPAVCKRCGFILCVSEKTGQQVEM